MVIERTQSLNIFFVAMTCVMCYSVDEQSACVEGLEGLFLVITSVMGI